MFDRHIKIGNILFAISAEKSMNMDKCLMPFFTDADTEARRADCRIGIKEHRSRTVKRRRIKNNMVFEADFSWGLYKGNNVSVGNRQSAAADYILTVPPVKSGRRRRLYAEFDDDFRNGTVYLYSEGENYFYYPLLELLTINLLAEDKGVLLHASCIDDNGSGYLFLGHSGAGKSTLANLWSTENGIRILSDDRVIVTLSDNGLIAHGTPWHGTADYAINVSVPVKKIFFINHSRHNSAIKIKGIKSASELARNAFLTFWDKERMERSTDTLMQISQHSAMFSLGFYPNQRVLDFVRNL